MDNLEDSILNNNKIPGSPGCDSFTRPEEISALSKFLSNKRRNQEQSLNLDNTLEDVPGKTTGLFHTIENLSDDYVKLSSEEQNEITKLGDSFVPLDAPVFDDELPKHLEELVFNREITELENSREDLEVEIVDSLSNSTVSLSVKNKIKSLDDTVENLKGNLIDPELMDTVIDLENINTGIKLEDNIATLPLDIKSEFGDIGLMDDLVLQPELLDEKIDSLEDTIIGLNDSFKVEEKLSTEIKNLLVDIENSKLDTTVVNLNSDEGITELNDTRIDLGKEEKISGLDTRTAKLENINNSIDLENSVEELYGVDNSISLDNDIEKLGGTEDSIELRDSIERLKEIDNSIELRDSIEKLDGTENSIKLGDSIEKLGGTEDLVELNKGIEKLNGTENLVELRDSIERLKEIDNSIELGDSIEKLNNTEDLVGLSDSIEKLNDTENLVELRDSIEKLNNTEDLVELNDSIIELLESDDTIVDSLSSDLSKLTIDTENVSELEDLLISLEKVSSNQEYFDNTKSEKLIYSDKDRVALGPNSSPLNDSDQRYFDNTKSGELIYSDNVKLSPNSSPLNDKDQKYFDNTRSKRLKYSDKDRVALGSSSSPLNDSDQEYFDNTRSEELIYSDNVKLSPNSSPLNDDDQEYFDNTNSDRLIYSKDDRVVINTDLPSDEIPSADTYNWFDNRPGKSNASLNMDLILGMKTIDSKEDGLSISSADVPRLDSRGKYDWFDNRTNTEGTEPLNESSLIYGKEVKNENRINTNISQDELPVENQMGNYKFPDLKKMSTEDLYNYILDFDVVIPRAKTLVTTTTLNSDSEWISYIKALTTAYLNPDNFEENETYKKSISKLKGFSTAIQGLIKASKKVGKLKFPSSNQDEDNQGEESIPTDSIPRLDSKGEYDWFDNRTNPDGTSPLSESSLIYGDDIGDEYKIKTEISQDELPELSVGNHKVFDSDDKLPEKYKTGARYHLPEKDFNTYTSLANTEISASDYIRWAAENTVDLAFSEKKGVDERNFEIHTTVLREARRLLLEETINLLVEQRNNLERLLKINKDRLPGNDIGIEKSILSDALSGGISFKKTAMSALTELVKVDTSDPINRPFLDKNGKKHTIGWKSASMMPSLAEEGKNPSKNNLAVPTKKTESLTSSDINYSYQNYLMGEGISRTLLELAGKDKNIDSFTVEGLFDVLKNSPYFTSSNKVTTTDQGYKVMTLDSNAHWEIIFEPYLGVLNNNYSFLPMINEINTRNRELHNVKTAYNHWIPISSFELQKEKLTTRSLGLFNGEIVFPIAMEYTNEFRITIVDDQFKSWRNYFERCAQASVFSSTPITKDENSSKIGIKKVVGKYKDTSDSGQSYFGKNGSVFESSGVEDSNYTADYEDVYDNETPITVDKNYQLVSPYKNITFRCKVLVMTPQLSTINMYDLLLVLKDISEDRSGEIDSSSSDLTLSFSIVGENPPDILSENRYKEQEQSSKITLRDSNKGNSLKSFGNSLISIL